MEFAKVKNIGRYKELIDSVRGLLQRLFVELEEVDYSKIDSFNLNISLFHGKKSITSWNEYIEVSRIIKNYPEITSHFNKLIGFIGSQAKRTESSFIQGFIVWNIWGINEFREETFLKKVEDFISFFIIDTIEVVKECKLFNFEASVEEINFDDEIVIKRIPYDDKKINHFTDGYEVFSTSDFVIEHRKTFNKIIRSTDSSDTKEYSKIMLSEFERYSNEISESFERVVKSIRVLKSSACYRGHRTREYYAGFLEQFGDSMGHSFLMNTAIGDKCKLEESEVNDLKSIWRGLKIADKLGALSANRLSYVAERKNSEDKVLDCFIGLESLYLPNGNAELSLRLSLGASKLLQSDSGKQKDLFFFLKRMYNKRSKLVHGQDVDVSSDELQRLEEVLRSSVKLYLESKDKFSKDSLNNVFF